MSLDVQVDRLKELEIVTERLNHHEDEKPGITIDEAISISKSVFPKEKYNSKDIFQILVASISDLNQQTIQSTEINNDQLSTALCASLAIMIYESSDAIGPYHLLWAKYLHNSIKFSIVQLHKENLSEEEYLKLLKESKELALRNGWSDMEALRQFHDHFFGDGWYLFPDESKYYPEPIGSSDLNKYQLVTNHFLLSMPHDFTIKELFNLMLEEIAELKAELESLKKEKLQSAFEATDVFIYLLHIATKRNLNISNLLSSHTTF